MFNSKIVHSLLLAGFLAFSSVAHATVTTIYNFGSLLTTNCPTAPDSFASNPFAQLQATDGGSGSWDFILSINSNLFSSFGDGAYVSRIKFDFTLDPVVRPVVELLDTNGAVKAVYASGDSSGGTNFDFGTLFGTKSSQRLTENEYVHWNVSNLALGSSLNNMYVHVQGIGGGYCGSDDCSAKYTPIITAIPEPETYVMLLAGLGLLGFMARRRMNNA